MITQILNTDYTDYRQYRLFLDDHIGYFNVRVVIALARCRFRAELDGYLRAPLQAGHALLAMMQPFGLTGCHFDIGYRADFLANSTGVAFLVGKEFLV